MRRKLLIATTNQGKLSEIEKVLGKDNYELLTLNDLQNVPEVEEDGQTFLENAQKKARAYANFSGLTTLSDDSGLEVDALFGQPGIYSARYAGVPKSDARNTAKLLANLGGLPAEKRTANFHTTIVVSWPQKPEKDLICNGELNGEIIFVPKGENGFGYDPIFYVEEKGKTLAQMTSVEKNEISHRGNALREMEQKINQWWENNEND